MHPPQVPQPSSTVPSQLSSTPLQVSSGGMHVPQVQSIAQVCEPIEPQLVVHEPALVAAHMKPSSRVPSQLSSMPLQISVAPGWTAGCVSSQSVFGTLPVIGQAMSP